MTTHLSCLFLLAAIPALALGACGPGGSPSHPDAALPDRAVLPDRPVLADRTVP